MTKLIPFRWLPGSWGLKGKAFERAEAEYLYEGETLERHLCDIEFEPGSPENAAAQADIDLRYGYISEYDRDVRSISAVSLVEQEKAVADIDFKHGLITDYEHAKRHAELIEDEIERKIALVEIEAQYGFIEQFKADKEIATLRDEPWVGGPSGTDPEGEFLFELDWNPQWITKLRSEGYTGATDEDVLNQWFTAICYNVVMSAHPEGVDPLVYDTARESLRRSFKE